MTHEARTVSVSIGKPAAAVYDYLADPRRFPEWSVFMTQIRPDGDGWIASTPAGEVRVAFVERNTFGVLDHDVTVNPELTVHVPLRVLKNGGGSEVLFTVFRLPRMTPAQFDDDVAMVKTDLANLKRVLESAGENPARPSAG